MSKKQQKNNLKAIKDIFYFDEIKDGYVTYLNSNSILFFIVIKGIKFSVLTQKEKMEARKKFSDYFDLVNRSFYQMALDDEPNLLPQIENYSKHKKNTTPLGRYIIDETLKYVEGNDALLRKFLFLYPIPLAKLNEDIYSITGALNTSKIEYHIPNKREIENIFSMLVNNQKQNEEELWWEEELKDE
jgi:hypothetical protein